mmetsp:Transcript_120799/g.349030  ORF Transcript_120799/g.349030 Transcript_120799/m.349030 type:complete len:111 (+) Transcript_120799:89-421(+)
MQMARALTMIVAVVAGTGTHAVAAPVDVAGHVADSKAASDDAASMKPSPSLRRTAGPQQGASAAIEESSMPAILTEDLNEEVEELSLSDVSLLGLQRTVNVVKKARRATR